MSIFNDIPTYLGAKSAQDVALADKLRALMQEAKSAEQAASMQDKLTRAIKESQARGMAQQAAQMRQAGWPTQAGTASQYGVVGGALGPAGAHLGPAGAQAADVRREVLEDVKPEVDIVWSPDMRVSVALGSVITGLSLDKAHDLVDDLLRAISRIRDERAIGGQ